MRVTLLAGVIVSLAVAPAVAQERPFLLSIATAPDEKPRMRFDYDVGVGEQAFQSATANQPEQRIGVQASRGRVTFLARLGIADAGNSSYQSSQAGEALFSILRPSRSVALAAGGGVLHEAGGVNVLLARAVAGRMTESWSLQGNLLFQKPLAEDRDAVDLITTIGWARKFSRGLSIGVEAIGEDLEGFWETEEAEGGARLLAGPSVHISPPGRRWQLTATGGPMFHPSDTHRASGALRDLPPETKRTSYAVKASLSIALTSTP
jgi:hypothetical protein